MVPVLAAVFGLVVGCGGPSSDAERVAFQTGLVAEAEQARPATVDADQVPERLVGCTNDGPAAPPSLPGADLLDGDVHRPGELVAFIWTDQVGDYVEAPSAVYIDCWTGTEWLGAWVAGVYGRMGRAPFASYDLQTPMTAEAHNETVGDFLVPRGAPPGEYRALLWLQDCTRGPITGTVPDSCVSRTAEVRFDVVPAMESEVDAGGVHEGGMPLVERAAAFRSGLSFDPPTGTTFVSGQGNVSADFFVFELPDGVSTVAIGRRLWAELPPDAERVTVGDREFWVIRYDLETRIREDPVPGISVEVVGRGAVAEDWLIDLMAGVNYDATTDRCSQESCG